jgi:ABC-type multidrug transport system permease subunit
VELPMTFAQTIVQFILVYFLVDMQGSYILLVLCAFGVGIASCSVAVALGCSVSDVKSVTELSPLLFVPQLLFVGFFIRTSQIPAFLRWAQYLCSLKYAMNLFIMTEFDLELESCRSSEAARNNCHSIIVNNDIETDRYYVYILVLFALFIVFRLIGAAILVQKAKRFY